MKPKTIIILVLIVLAHDVSDHLYGWFIGSWICAGFSRCQDDTEITSISLRKIF